MIHLPIVERELRVASRRTMTYWSRSGFGCLAVALTLWAVWMRGLGAAGTTAGRETFRTLSFVALFSAVGTALRLTAPSIAGEKRGGTLGLLFLTDLKPHDVVFGKLAVTSLTAFYRFLAIVPVLGIPILLGGVTAGDLARLALVLINLMFLAATLGLFASTLATDEKGASGLATLLLIFVMAAGPLTSLLAFWLGCPNPILDFLVSLSPGFACVSMMGQMGGAGGFWTSWIVGHLCGWLLLAWTCRLLPRVWQDRPASAAQARRRERVRTFSQGDTLFRRARRAELLSINPILWLTSRDRAVRWYPWIFLGAVGGLMLWATLKYNAGWTERSLTLGATALLHVFFKVWLGSQSSLTFSADRDRGALELLLSTPLTTRDLIRGHWLGLRRLFGAPLAVLLAGGVFWVIWVLVDGRDSTDHKLAFWFYAYAANFLVFCADVWALGWLGLWMGVKSKNSREASSSTQTRLLLLPWLAAMASMLATSFFVEYRDEFTWWLGFWLFWSLSIDVAYARLAKRRLEVSLRAAALERYSAQPGEAPGWVKALARGLARALARPKAG